MAHVARQPLVFDAGGSLEDFGAQLSFIATVAGMHRVRVRGMGSWDCPGYEMSVTVGPQETAGRWPTPH